jgi:hypothetical protein
VKGGEVLDVLGNGIESRFCFHPSPNTVSQLYRNGWLGVAKGKGDRNTRHSSWRGSRGRAQQDPVELARTPDKMRKTLKTEANCTPAQTNCKTIRNLDMIEVRYEFRYAGKMRVM